MRSLVSTFRFISFFLLCFILNGANDAPVILSGPLVTHTTMHTVLIWAQTDRATKLQLEYWKTGKSDKKWYSKSVETTENNGFTAKLLAKKGIEPGNRYDYRILLGEEKKVVLPLFRDGYKKQGFIPLSFQSKPRWRWIPDEATGAKHKIFNFRFAMGSCSYFNQKGADREGSKPYGSNYQIFESIYEKYPDLMLWLGDNIYYRENDFESREGLIKRWSHDRQTAELRPLFANTVHYATWDDHDYGPNNIGRTYWLKEDATEVFNLMWGNPSAGLPEIPGIFTYFNWGDVNVYLLDNRTYLMPSEGSSDAFGLEKTLLGKKQIDWLVDHLSWNKSQSYDNSSYPSRFNLIVMGSSVLSNNNNPDSYRKFGKEWQYLMDRIVSEKIPGVVFLSGDTHNGEVNKIVHSWQNNSSIFYEIISSPLTAGVSPNGRSNSARFDIFSGKQDRVMEQNFVTLDFQGPLDNRTMTIRYWNSNGDLINQKTGASTGTPTDASVIYANDLVPN